MKSLCLALALMSLPAIAQQAPAPAAANAEPRYYISATELAELVSKATASAQSSLSVNGKTLLQCGPFRAKLEYHKEIPQGKTVNFRANVNDAELLVVLEGSGTIVFGGTLADPTPAGGGGFVGKSVAGAVTYKLVKGDMIMIPENSPHAVTQVEGTLVMMSLHLPHPAGVPAPAR